MNRLDFLNHSYFNPYHSYFNGIDGLYKLQKAFLSVETIPDQGYRGKLKSLTCLLLIIYSFKNIFKPLKKFNILQ
jgi:hypothetical protein